MMSCQEDLFLFLTIMISYQVFFYMRIGNRQRGEFTFCSHKNKLVLDPTKWKTIGQLLHGGGWAAWLTLSHNCLWVDL